jgi:hypothetical protein
MFGKPSELRKLTNVINSVSAQYKESFMLDFEELKRLSNMEEIKLE